MIEVDMQAGDASLGLYQVVDPEWNFVVTCDWQCRPQDEQSMLDETYAEGQQTTIPTEVALQSQTLDEADAQIGLYQLVDPRWNFAVSCDWQCKPEGEQTTVLTEGEDMQPVTEMKAPQPPARTKCNVPLSEDDARIGLYQMVDYRWNYVVSCDWQCKPVGERGRKSKSAARQREPGEAKEVKEKAESVALSEEDARLGLYQIVSPRWEYVVSCDWQCRPAGEAAGEPPPAEPADEVPPAEPAAEARESAAVPLSESDAQLGLYQLVSPTWDFWISCDWQCRPPGESEVQEEMEKAEYQVEEDVCVSPCSSMSSCREGEARQSLFVQTGDIMMTLEGDEGDVGLVMIDELGSAARLQQPSADVAVLQQDAEQRRRQLAQLVIELGEDVCNCRTLLSTYLICADLSNKYKYNSYFYCAP